MEGAKGQAPFVMEPLDGHFAGITRVSVAPENGACYFETFLDRYHAEEQLVQKARPQARVPLTCQHGHNRSKNECRRFRAEKDIAKLWRVESRYKAAIRLESFALTTRERRKARS